MRFRIFDIKLQQILKVEPQPIYKVSKNCTQEFIVFLWLSDVWNALEPQARKERFKL